MSYRNTGSTGSARFEPAEPVAWLEVRHATFVYPVWSAAIMLRYRVRVVRGVLVDCWTPTPVASVRRVG
jgi:hypothetical protein